MLFTPSLCVLNDLEIRGTIDSFDDVICFFTLIKFHMYVGQVICKIKFHRNFYDVLYYKNIRYFQEGGRQVLRAPKRCRRYGFQ